MVQEASPQARAFAGSLAAFAAADRILIALDFDGTLSPLVDDPAGARVLPRAAEAIRTLERLPDTWVAYVSGRPLESLARVTEADDSALLIGSHGVEVRLDGGVIDVGLDADEASRLSALDAALDRLVAVTQNAKLERKPAGLGLHSRAMDQNDVPAFQAAARHAADEVGGFTERDGKDILEFAVRNATKGDSVDSLRERLGADAVLYAGDDVTDEDGFAVMREHDLGVKVGEGDTAAQFRVADPEALAVMLTLLAGARQQALAQR